MTAEAMARSFLRRAAAVLREAERLHSDGAWNLVVRRCQEATFYGDEESDTEAEALFSQADAEEALRNARLALDLCARGVPPAPA